VAALPVIEDLDVIEDVEHRFLPCFVGDMINLFGFQRVKPRLGRGIVAALTLRVPNNFLYGSWNKRSYAWLTAFDTPDKHIGRIQAVVATA
jgi:hypothetical protein